jgi:hypothetical protein
MNLNGKTVSGYFKAVNGSPNGFEIYNGTINCNNISQRGILNVSRSSNVATITFASNHFVINGSVLQVVAVSTGGFDTGASGATMTVVNSTTLTYPNVGVDVASTGSGGGLLQTPDTARGGCINFTSATVNPTTANKVHDLVVRNNNLGDASLLSFDWSTASDGTVPVIQVYNNDLQSPSGGFSRTYNVYLEGNSSRTWKQAEAFNNIIRFATTSYGQQGVMFYNCARCEAYNNHGIGATVLASVSEGGRMFGADANSTPGSKTAKIYQNYIEGISNNRATRVRGSSDVQITNNTITGVETANTIEGNCFHLGDPDSGDTDLGALTITGNSCGIKGAGVGGWLRNAYSSTTMNIANNTFTCDAAGCASAKTWFLRQALAGGRSEFTCMKNDTYTTITPNNVYDKGSSVAPKWNYASINTPTFSGTGTVALAANAGCP